MASDTTEGVMERLTLYCNAMQVPFAPVEFEGDELLWTDDLHNWIMAEGISLRWLMTGEATPPEDPDFRRLMDRLTQDEKDRLLAALREHNASGGDLQQIMRRHGFGDFDYL